MLRVTLTVNGQVDTRIDLRHDFRGIIRVPRHQRLGAAAPRLDAVVAAGRGRRRRPALALRRGGQVLQQSNLPQIISVLCLVLGAVLVLTSKIESSSWWTNTRGMNGPDLSLAVLSTDSALDPFNNNDNNAHIPNVDLLSIIDDLTSHARRFVLTRHMQDNRYLTEQVTGPITGNVRYQGVSFSSFAQWRGQQDGETSKAGTAVDDNEAAYFTGNALEWARQVVRDMCDPLVLFASIHNKRTHAQNSAVAHVFDAIRTACSRLGDDFWLTMSPITGLRAQTLATLESIIVGLEGFQGLLVVLERGDLGVERARYEFLQQRQLRYSNETRHQQQGNVSSDPPCWWWWRRMLETEEGPLARLDWTSLTSSSSTAKPFALDPLTTVVLTYLRGSSLVPQKAATLDWTAKAQMVPITHRIRGALADERRDLERLLGKGEPMEDLMSSVREWLGLVTDKAEEEVKEDGESNKTRTTKKDQRRHLNVTAHTESPTPDRGCDHNSNRHGKNHENGDATTDEWFQKDKDRLMRAIVEGLDLLTLLLDSLSRYKRTLPSLEARLNRWDEATERLAAEADLVLGADWSLVGTRGTHGRDDDFESSSFSSSSSSSETGGGNPQGLPKGATAKRWQIRSGPFLELFQMRFGLLRLSLRLGEARDEYGQQVSAAENSWFLRDFQAWARRVMLERETWAAEDEAKWSSRKGAAASAWEYLKSRW